MKNQQTNWKGLFLVGIPSVGLGWFVDLLLSFNNYSFLISGLLPVIMVSLYREYLVVDGGGKPKKTTNLTSNYNKWRHRMFSFIVFLFITRLIFGIIALIFRMPLNDLKIDYKLFVAISLTTILITVLGDKILVWWFKSGGLEKALDRQDDFFNQNNVKMLIYFSYLVLIFATNCGVKSEFSQLWINTFATYVAFERFGKFWQERKNTKPAVNK